MREGARHDANPGLFAQGRAMFAEEDRVGRSIEDVTEPCSRISEKGAIGNTACVALDLNDFGCCGVNVGEDLTGCSGTTFAPTALLAVAGNLVTSSNDDFTAVNES